MKSITIKAPTDSREQPELRFRIFTAHYFGPGTVRGSRIVITDKRHNKRKILDYADDAGRTFEQAATYLRGRGITVDALGLANKDHDCVLLSKDMATPLR